VQAFYGIFLTFVDIFHQTQFSNYSRGIISSRKIEKACKENIIAKTLADDSEPDHNTIATGNSTVLKVGIVRIVH